MPAAQPTREPQRVHVIAGASGTGTTTRAFELRRAWEDDPSLVRPVSIVHTDVVRALLRTAVDAGTCPDLFGESFTLAAQEGDEVVDGVSVTAFERQCAPILRAVRAAIAYSLDEGWHVIAEGVHLLPGLLELDLPAHVRLTSELLVVDDEADHVGRLRSRDAASDGRRSAAHYEANLARVRAVQEHLRSLERRTGPDA
jgi:2-phosphoglycerate kinase